MRGMSELNAIESVDFPLTRQDMAAQFRKHGIFSGITLLVHSSLSSIGWVSGGPVAVVLALMDAVTPEGTLIMPAFSGDLSDPANWQNPPVPESWWQPIRDSLPAYHPAYTPTRKMGRIVDVFRSMPNVIRSQHPASSFAAWGKNAAFITNNHSLMKSLGDSSPLARIYDLDGYVLLLGVGFGNNTSFHLAEVRSGISSPIREGAPMIVDGERKWLEYTDIAYDSGSFETVGAEFLKSVINPLFKLGAGQCHLFKQRPAVDFAVNWFKNRS